MQGIAGRQHSPSYFHSASFEHQIIFHLFMKIPSIRLSMRRRGQLDYDHEGVTNGVAAAGTRDW